MIVQVLVFTVAAIVLLGLRSTDLTALLSVLALALSGVAGGGPLLGAEHALPFGLWRVLTVFALDGGPAGLSDHRARDPLLPVAVAAHPRRRWLIGVPFVVAAPMLVTAACTALYLVGVDGLRDARSGTPRIRGPTTGPLPRRSRSTSRSSSKACIATGSTTTRTSGAGSGWPSTRPCPACSPTR